MRFLLFIFVSFFWIKSAQAQVASAGALAGKIKDRVYISANGTFRIPVPVVLELGATISDNDNVVTFDDDFKTHLSIAAFPFSREQRWEYETRGVRDYLIYFFTNFVQADFAQRYPGSKIESARFVPTLESGSLLAYSLHPGGSFFEAKSTLGIVPQAPVVAKRGSLCFIKNGVVFVISTELAERALERSSYHRTMTEEDEMLRQSLTSTLAHMEFTAPTVSGK